MFKCICFILYNILFVVILSSKTVDTTNNYRLKGIDVTIGGGEYNYGNKTAVNFLKVMTPQDVRGNYNYNEINTNDKTVNPVKIGLNFIFGTNKKSKNYLIHKQEFLFRFSFESEQDHANYNNVKWAIYNSSMTFDARSYYTYQTQALGLGYQFSSKSLLKNFAIFGGISSDFGMLTIKQISNIYNEHILFQDENPNNFYSTFARTNCNLGIKYNFSCDMNFFIQAELGLIQYGKEINTNGTYGGASFGIRYKFLEDQDKLNYKNNSFW